MVKRRKEEKEMGGAEKIRMKKKKMLAQEAAKCAKLTDLFRTEKGAVAGSSDQNQNQNQNQNELYCQVCLHIRGICFRDRSSAVQQNDSDRT